MRTDLIGTGTYPDKVSKNCTTGDSKDGTPVNAELVDDLWGFGQACTNQGNVTPSNSNETYDSSDILNGIRNICGTPGEIVYSAINYSSISALGARLLYAAGQIVLCSSYPLLVSYCYVGDSSNATAQAFYKCDSGGTRNTSGLYIKIPDLRNYFIRGLNPGNQDFYQQNDTIKQHRHTVRSPDYGSNGYAHSSSKNSAATGTAFTAVTLNTDTLSGNPVYAYYDGQDVDGNSFSSSETRPKNVSVRCYIRY